MYDVIAVGTAAIDLFADTESELLTTQTNGAKQKHICYPSGTKILMKRLDFFTGGGGTNTAVSFARLGLKTAFLGNMGLDDDADFILKELKKEKVDFIGTRSKDKTNYSIVLDSIEHDRTILIYRGASDHLSFDRIAKSKLKAKWFYFTSLMGQSYQTSLDLLKFAKKNRIKTAANISSYLAAKGAKELKPMLERLDVLIFNKEEAQQMLRTKTGDIYELLRRSKSCGPGIVVITNGKEGAYCCDGAYYYFLPASKIRVIESTGAGDAFASGFIAGMIKWKGVEFSMKIGLANAQSVIRHVGSKHNLLKWNSALRDAKIYKMKVIKKPQ
ncbi:Carbohydrate kinase [sediment metagenome]|uniref:Carbohydrate kinase n=1 Tax=sediment metagenome TaxID=749907 RepID=D9PEX2_9ZZZZ